jgi:hypothetical protein
MPNPMTKKQRVTHFEMFSAACRANGWTFASHRLVIDSATPADGNPAVRSTFARQTLAAAAAVAERDGCPVLDNDLRHAVYFLATGKHSVSQLDSGRDTDRVFAFLTLMIDETNLDAQIVLDDPEAQDRKRIIHRIRELAPESYIRKILLDEGDYTTRLQDLTTRRLQQLVYTLSARSRSAARRGTSISHRRSGDGSSPSPDFPHVPNTTGTGTTTPAAPHLALPKLPAQNEAEPTPPTQSPSGAPGTAAGPISPSVASVPSVANPPSHETDDNCPF